MRAVWTWPGSAERSSTRVLSTGSKERALAAASPVRWLSLPAAGGHFSGNERTPVITRDFVVRSMSLASGLICTARETRLCARALT